MPKPFLDYDQQIQKLQSKNLVIVDAEKAKEHLRLKGYFSLITGYKELFKNPTTKKYRDGTTFDDIVALYEFDAQLRELTLRYLLHIETHLRSALSYAFCNRYGAQQSAYLDPNNYAYQSQSNQEGIDKLIDRFLSRPLNQNTDCQYIEHYKIHHGNVPLWVLMNNLTFGTLSKMYQYSTFDMQAEVSKEFYGIDEGQLRQILQVLTLFRNKCAHNERLFSYHSNTHEIPDLPLHQKLNIPKHGNQYLHGKGDFFSLLIAFRYLLPPSEFSEYKRHLVRLIDKAIKGNNQIPESKLLEIMGFPTNWKQITAYKKV